MEIDQQDMDNAINLVNELIAHPEGNTEQLIRFRNILNNDPTRDEFDRLMVWMHDIHAQLRGE